jgi:transcriptional regulator with XRE-family HTH domain
MKVTTWREALGELLRAGKVYQANLAADVRLHRVVLNRYINGDRKPEEETVRRINAALAHRLGDDNVRKYLDALHSLESVRAGEEPPTYAVSDCLELLLDATTVYLRDDAKARRELWQSIQNTKLMIALSAIHHRHLLRHIIGDAEPRQTWFDDLQTVCRRYGVDLRRWLRPERELKAARALDSFIVTMEKALSVIPDPSERLQAEQDLLVAAVRLAAINRNIQKGKQ